MAPIKEVAAIAAISSYLLAGPLTQYRYLLGRPGYAWDFLQLVLLQSSIYLFYEVVLYSRFFSPLRHLPGPRGNSLFMGQYSKLNSEKIGRPLEEWCRDIPNEGLIRYLDMFNWERVMVTSPAALREMLVTKCYDFVKPTSTARLLIYFFGAGMPFVEGDLHRFQKKTMMPAFSFRHIIELYPIFWTYSKEFAASVTAEVEQNAGKSKVTNGSSHPIEADQAVIDAVKWFKTITLDIMGIAGMGQDFEARRNKEDNKLVKAYHTLFSPGLQSAIVYWLRSMRLGWLVQFLPLSKNTEMEEAKHVIRDTCRQLIRAKSDKLETGKLSDVDVLSVAIQSGGFNDEQLIDQITTFLLAGHETTAVSMIWATYGLSQHPDIQKRLRAEVRAKLPSPVGASDVTSVDIDKVPYLIAVCNEILRFYDVFVWTRREAGIDTSLCGQHIPKGTSIVIPFTAIHRDKSIWGDDADVFNPDRWMPDEKSGSTRVTNGGVTSNFGVMSFLHGPRSCIGEAFARAEFACLLAAWVGQFEFELNDKNEMNRENLETGGGFTVGPINPLDIRVRVIPGW